MDTSTPPPQQNLWAWIEEPFTPVRISVASVISEAIETFRKKHTDVRNFPWPAVRSERMIQRLSEGPWVIIFQPFPPDPCPPALTVRLLPHTAKPTPDRLQSRCQGRWISLETHILRIAALYARTQRWEAQRVQWNEKGKSFPLMNLPRELRDLVYYHIYNHEVVPIYRGHPVNKIYMAGLETNCWLNMECQVPNSYNGVGRVRNTALLRVSKQVSEEAKEMIWSQRTVKFLPSMNFFRTTVIRGVMPTKCLSRLHIVADLACFGIELPAKGYIRRATRIRKAISCQATAFTHLKALKYLELQCGNQSKEPSSYPNPWRYAKANFLSFNVFPDMESNFNEIDWLMAAAYPFIGHVPKIYLVGHGSEENQEKWAFYYKSARAKWQDDARVIGKGQDLLAI